MLHQVLVTPPKEDCYIFKRPESARWHYFLSIPGEGVERKSTGVQGAKDDIELGQSEACLLYTSPSPRDPNRSRMPSSA